MERYFSLHKFNTFHLSVIASYYIKLTDQNQIKEILRQQVVRSEKKLVLGGGSNVLFLDDFFDGVVMHIATKGKKIISETDDEIIIRVAAGESWPDLVSEMTRAGYGGIENLALIPGTVGAAPIQNIGAYGVEFQDFFEKLTAIDLKKGEVVEFTRSDCEFGYRSSIFKSTHKNRYLITEVDLKLQKHPKPNLTYGALNEYVSNKTEHPGIIEVMEAVVAVRKSKLPDPKELGNAGSFFKNPVIHSLLYKDLQKEFPDIPGYQNDDDTVKISAAWLLEHCHWKGQRIGNCSFHEKQALVLVNHGQATGRELFHLAMKAKQSVIEKFGIELEHEVNIV